MASEVVGVVLCVAMTVAMAAGVVVWINVPGFGGPSSAVAVAGPGMVGASWSEADRCATIEEYGPVKHVNEHGRWDGTWDYGLRLVKRWPALCPDAQTPAPAEPEQREASATNEGGPTVPGPGPAPPPRVGR